MVSPHSPHADSPAHEVRVVNVGARHGANGRTDLKTSSVRPAAGATPDAGSTGIAALRHGEAVFASRLHSGRAEFGRGLPGATPEPVVGVEHDR